MGNAKRVDRERKAYEPSNFPLLSAVELGRLIETKDVSPVEVTEAYLQRIEALDFKFNAYLTVCRTPALQAAREAEREIMQGISRATARHPRGGQRSTLVRRYPNHWRLAYPGQFRP